MLAWTSLFVWYILFYNANELQISWKSVLELKQFFCILNINLKKIFFISIFISASYEIFVKLRCIFNLLKTIYRQLSWHFPSMQVTYIPMPKIQWLFNFIIIFHAFAGSFSIPINNMTNSTTHSIFYHKQYINLS